MFYLSPASLAWSNLNHSLPFTYFIHRLAMLVSFSFSVLSGFILPPGHYAAHYVWSTLFSSDTCPPVLHIQLPKKTSQGFLHFSLETLPFSCLHLPNMTGIVSLS